MSDSSTSPTVLPYDCTLHFAQLADDIIVANSLDDLEPKSHQGCVFCSKVAKLLCCSLCKAEMYCCKDCQLADWKTHKILCKHWLSDQVQKPPFPGARRVIIFEEHVPNIRFAWIRVEKPKKIVGGKTIELEGEFPDLHKFGIETRVDHRRSSPRMYENEKWPKNFVRDGRPFDDVYLQFWHCDNALDKRVFKPNAAGAKYFPETENSIQGSVWPGPLVVARLNKSPETMLNMHIRDFREAADFFVKFSRRSQSGFEIGVRALSADEPTPDSGEVIDLSALSLQIESLFLGSETIV